MAANHILGGAFIIIKISGKTELAFVSGPRLPALKGRRYIECLEAHVVPYTHFIGESCIFMHDNTRELAHTAGIV